MTSTERHQGWLSRTHLRASGIVLTIASVLTAAVLTTPSAQAQTLRRLRVTVKLYG